MAPERFALREPCLLSVLGVELPVGARDIAIGGIARFGATSPGDLCFCDRLPGDAFSVEPGSVVFCPQELLGALEARFPAACFVPLDDARAAFIDLGVRLLDAGATGSPVPGPLGVALTARIGAGTVVHPESRVDSDVEVGSNCVIHRGTWLQQGAKVRDGTVIGSEGINAYRGKDGRQRGFPHFAGVVVCAGAEIGAGAVVVRGILNSTRIGRDAVVGNLANIGHGVEIGDRVWMSVGCLVGGHARIGVGATLGMGVVVRDNVQIGGSAQIGMASVVVRDLDADVSVFGNPARVVPRIQAGPVR
jgi:UDP-3-O-[3-hydroxymyristoyl] glucosamine N-acyltransferase